MPHSSSQQRLTTDRSSRSATRSGVHIISRHKWSVTFRVHHCSIFRLRVTWECLILESHVTVCYATRGHIRYERQSMYMATSVCIRNDSITTGTISIPVNKILSMIVSRNDTMTNVINIVTRYLVQPMTGGHTRYDARVEHTHLL